MTHGRPEAPARRRGGQTRGGAAAAYGGCKDASAAWTAGVLAGGLAAGAEMQYDGIRG